MPPQPIALVDPKPPRPVPLLQRILGIFFEALVFGTDEGFDPACLRCEHHVDARRGLGQFAVDRGRERMKQIGVLRAEHPERAAAFRAEMALRGAEFAAMPPVVELGMISRSVTFHRQCPLVGVEIYRVPAPAGGLSAYRAIAAHEWYWRLAVGGKADLSAAARPFELQGHSRILSHRILANARAVPFDSPI